MLRRKRFWFGLVISLLFLGFFLARTDFRGIGDAFGQANLLLALAVTPLYFAGFWLRTIRWRYLLRPVSEISTWRLYPIVLIGLMANNVAPARVGELVRAYLLGEKLSMSKSTALGTIAVDRVFDGLTLVAILGIVTVFSGSNRAIQGVGIGAAALFAVAIVVLVTLVYSPTRGRRWLLNLIALLPSKLRFLLESILDAFLSGLIALRNPDVLVKAGLFSVASWLVEGTMYYFIGEAFHLNVAFDVYLLILAGANLALSILQTPGGIGPFEATTQQILISFWGAEVTSQAAAQISAYTLALHALLLGPVIVVGFVLLWTTQLSLGDILGTGKAGPVTPATETGLGQAPE